MAACADSCSDLSKHLKATAVQRVQEPLQVRMILMLQTTSEIRALLAADLADGKLTASWRLASLHLHDVAVAVARRATFICSGAQDLQRMHCRNANGKGVPTHGRDHLPRAILPGVSDGSQGRDG